MRLNLSEPLEVVSVRPGLEVARKVQVVRTYRSTVYVVAADASAGDQVYAFDSTTGEPTIHSPAPFKLRNVLHHVSIVLYKDGTAAWSPFPLAPPLAPGVVAAYLDADVKLLE